MTHPISYSTIYGGFHYSRLSRLDIAYENMHVAYTYDNFGVSGKKLIRLRGSYLCIL